MITYIFDCCELWNVSFKWRIIGDKTKSLKWLCKRFFVFIACQVMSGWPCNKYCDRIKNMVKCLQQLTQYRWLMIIDVSFYDKSYILPVLMLILFYIFVRITHSVIHRNQNRFKISMICNITSLHWLRYVLWQLQKKFYLSVWLIFLVASGYW